MVSLDKRHSAQDVLAENLLDPDFRAEWERTALARAVALAVVSYRAKHGLTQTQLARQIGARQPFVARLEMGEHAPSLATLQRLSRSLGLRLIVEVAPALDGEQRSPLTLPPELEIVEDVTLADGSRVLLATG